MEGTAAVVLNNNHTLAQRVRNHLEDTKSSIAALAKEINYSRSTISRYLSGKYEGDSSDVEEKLIGYLSVHTGKQVELPLPTVKTRAKPRFFESRDAKSVVGLCQVCQGEAELGIIVGRSGYGKTHTLKEYAKLPRVAYIECGASMACRDLVEEIECALGIPKSYGTLRGRANGIKDYFKVNKGYLLIIDEADKLISKQTQKKMEILREIFDQSEVGLVIAGEPRLEALIKTYLERMAKRMTFIYKLHGLSPSEVKDYLSGFDVTDDALTELKARACNMQTGCFRLLDRTLSNVIRILQDTHQDTVTVKIIEQASSMMML